MADTSPSRPTYTVDFVPSTTRNAVFLGNPLLDSMMTCMLALGAEVWADKRRLKVIESLLAAKREVTAASIEAYVPTPAEEKAWAAERDLLIQNVFGKLKEVKPAAGS